MSRKLSKSETAVLRAIEDAEANGEEIAASDLFRALCRVPNVGPARILRAIDTLIEKHEITVTREEPVEIVLDGETVVGKPKRFLGTLSFIRAKRDAELAAAAEKLPGAPCSRCIGDVGGSGRATLATRRITHRGNVLIYCDDCRDALVEWDPRNVESDEPIVIVTTNTAGLEPHVAEAVEMLAAEMRSGGFGKAIESLDETVEEDTLTYSRGIGSGAVHVRQDDALPRTEIGRTTLAVHSNVEIAPHVCVATGCRDGFRHGETYLATRLVRVVAGATRSGERRIPLTARRHLRCAEIELLANAETSSSLPEDVAERVLLDRSREIARRDAGETVDPDGTVRDSLGNAVGIDQPAAAKTLYVFDVESDPLQPTPIGTFLRYDESAVIFFAEGEDETDTRVAPADCVTVETLASAAARIEATKYPKTITKRRDQVLAGDVFQSSHGYRLLVTEVRDDAESRSDDRHVHIFGHLHAEPEAPIRGEAYPASSTVEVEIPENAAGRRSKLVL